jgi:hypothetical protein
LSVDPPVILISPPTEEASRLWGIALDLAEAFGVQEDWSLIGGLMVQLHGLQHDDDPRPTVDIDVLGNSRRQPVMTERLAQILIDRGGEVAMPPRSDKKLGYRFEVDGEVVEILAPDGLSSDPETVNGLTTFQVPGGTQALGRTETVLVSLDGAPPRTLRRPGLLGAILIKARVVAKQRPEKFDSDRQDLIRLLSYVEDPRGLAAQEGLKDSEKKWLRKIETDLDAKDPTVVALASPDVLERAHQALALLTA